MQSRDDTAIERIALRPAEAAEALGVCRTTIYRMMETGEIPSIKIGRAKRILVEDLRNWRSRR
jgi:excisionase family DNA binding protein